MSENYDIKDGKHLAFKHKNNGQQRFIRCRSLGYRYQESMLQLRVDTEFLDAKDVVEKPVPERYIKRVIDLTKNDKFKENPGLQYWGINHNNLAISQTIYHLHQLGIGSFKQLENYISQTTLSLEKDKKELVKLEKEALDILEVKEVLIKLKDEELDNEVLLTLFNDLTSNKPNKELEDNIYLLRSKGVYFENTVQFKEVINGTNNLYLSLIDNIIKVTNRIEVKNINIKNYNLISKNFKKFLDRSREEQIYDF